MSDETTQREGPMQQSQNAQVVAQFDQDEFEWLMSLALDEQLSAAESARFDALLAQAEVGAVADREPAATWALWQEMDAWLDSEPRIAPTPGFSGQVMQRLAWQERRRRLWFGAAVGVAAVLLWGTGLIGVLGLVALFTANEALWLGEIMNSLAYWWSMVSGFWVSALRSAGAILATSQARAIILIYCSMSAGMLSLWWIWLRRSTRVDASTPIFR